MTERRLAAGAVILGKANMSEFAMATASEHAAYGPAPNPWPLARAPVGSSGGAAAGAAARVGVGVAVLEAAGAIVEEVSLRRTDYGLATYYIVAPAEASANLARYDGIRYGPRLEDGDVLANYLAPRGRLFGPEVKR